MAGVPDLNHDLKVIGVSVFSDFDTTMMFAVEPIAEPFPPNPTPNTNAHHNKFIPTKPDSAIEVRIGIIATVRGILSTIADRIAAAHRIIIAVITKLDSAPATMYSATKSNTPADSRPPTMINKDTKNNSTESSTFSKISCGSLREDTAHSANPAPIIATKAGAMWK